MSNGAEDKKEREKDALALFAEKISDAGFRHSFWENPEKALRDLGIYGDLSPAMITFLGSLSLDELRLMSRFHAAAKQADVGEKTKSARFLSHF